MVTKETAQRIAEICDEVWECQRAVDLLISDKKQEAPLIHVFKDEDDEGFCISVSKANAIDVIEKTLENLKEEYSALNDRVLKEAQTVAVVKPNKHGGRRRRISAGEGRN